MIVENGKRYVRADGEITGVIEDSGSITHGHRDPNSNQSYTKFGSSYFCGGWYSGYDLISEYIEPSPQYGPWIPWAGGECPVEGGTMGQVQLGDDKRNEVKLAPPTLMAKLVWVNQNDDYDIIYYRVLIEEPEVTTDVMWIGIDGRTWSSPYDNSRKAIITVQGDKLGIEWAPVDEGKQ